MSDIAKYSYHFMRGLLVKLQWYVYQNKVAVAFLEITFYSLGKVTSLLGAREKSVFSVIASKSLKSSLFHICRTRLELNAWNPYIKDATVILGGGGGGGGRGSMEFSKNNISALQYFLYIGLLKNSRKNIFAPYKFHSPTQRINWCAP